MEVLPPGLYPIEALDLCWFVNSPPLLKGLDVDLLCTRTAFNLSRLNIEHADFKKWVANLEHRRRIRLGLYFEDLVLYAIQHLSNYELLAHDVQVFSGGRTLGAFDFIVRAPDGKIEHWEAAVKFFLQSAPTTDWSFWVGPNGRDSLHRKMTKMLDRQIHLSAHPEAKRTLEEMGVPVPDKQRILSKGILFQPMLHQDWPKADYAHPEQPKGYWIRVMDFLQYLSEAGEKSLWKVRLKPNWMSNIQVQESNDLYNSEQIRGLLHGHTRALMLSELRSSDFGFSEHRRWIVLAEVWPIPQLKH